MLNIVSLVLLIVGYNLSTAALVDAGGGRSQISILVKAGDPIYIWLTVALILCAVDCLHCSTCQKQKLILYSVLAVLALMGVRAGYVCYLLFEDLIFSAGIVPKSIVQYSMEVVVVIIYTILGFSLPR